MCKYADYIDRVFRVEGSAKFVTPGHQEIELALVKLYHATGEKKYLDLSAFFIDNRGRNDKDAAADQWSQGRQAQDHAPCAEQTTAEGHSVRAAYMYSAMADIARERGDEALKQACRKIFDNIANRRMYITAGVGSTHCGEAYTHDYNLPNETAYTETCAGIGLMFFSNAMLSLENNARYADAIERVLYNGVLSGLSLNGKAFFYENPLEINLREKYENRIGKRRLPITQRVECFQCSCCPPNINRLLPSLGNYVYGSDGDTLYVNQFISSKLDADGVSCTQTTGYPNDGGVKLSVSGVKNVAIRIPKWCDSFKINKPYEMKNGYAVVLNDGAEIEVSFDLTPKVVFADPRVRHDACRVAVMRGPIVYCAEAVDNKDELHTVLFPSEIKATETFDEKFGLYTLTVPCKRRLPLKRDYIQTKHRR
jgi:DUF1680 family protein